MEATLEPVAEHPIADPDVLKFLRDRFPSFSDDLVQPLKTGQSLCHYTGLDGAIGIVQGNDLWLTNSRYSNDEDEQNYGHDLIDEVLAELEKSDERFYRKLRRAARKARSGHVYVCCFCEKANLLGQWRGYGGNGVGVALEFDPDMFVKVAGADCLRGLMRLWRVSYDRDRQRGVVNDCVLSNPWSTLPEDDRIRRIVDALQFFVPTFKHPDFSDERERRLIFTPRLDAARDLKFRVRQGLLVPYYGLRSLVAPNAPFSLQLKRVLVGPGAHRVLNEQSVRLMLATSGHPDVPVEVSSTPYRG